MQVSTTTTRQTAPIEFITVRLTLTEQEARILRAAMGNRNSELEVGLDRAIKEAAFVKPAAPADGSDAARLFDKIAAELHSAIRE